MLLTMQVACVCPMSVAAKSELLDLFRSEIEALHGRAYIASSIPEIVNLISSIAVQTDCKRILKQKLLIDGEDQIASELSKSGLQVSELEELSDPVDALRSADLTITRVDLLIASTGTLVIGTSEDDERLASCLPRVHVAIVSASNVVQDPKDAATYLRKKMTGDSPGNVAFISGASRTADIEMKLILGVHGPHEVHVIILNS